jgi:uncharacterized Zn-finger protein
MNIKKILLLIIVICGFEQVAQGASGEDIYRCMEGRSVQKLIGDVEDFVDYEEAEDKGAPVAAALVGENPVDAEEVSPRRRSALAARARSSGKTTITKAAVAKAEKPSKDRPHQCSYCDKAFTQSGNLRVHERIHTGEKPYQCTQCDKAFAASSNLRSHERVHSGEKPFRCTQCDKAFTKSSDLKAHGRVHSGERPHQCSYCDKAFTQSGSLRNHERVHSGERPHQCSYCDKAFTQSGSLRNHERVHSGGRPFLCTHAGCDKAFSDPSNLRAHKKVHAKPKSVNE